MLRFSERACLGAALAVVALTLSACGASLDRDDAVDTYLLVNPDATPESANCVIDALLETYSEERVQTEIEAQRPSEVEDGSEANANQETEDLPGSEVAIVDLRDGSVSADFEEDQFRAAFSCSDVAQQLQTELEASGLSATDATCVAASLTQNLDNQSIDALLSGVSDQVLDSKFRETMAGCGLPTVEPEEN